MQTPQIPALHDKAIAKAHAKHVDLVHRRAEQGRAVAEAQAAPEAALAADDGARAEAEFEGKPEPKPTSDATERALRDAQQRQKALAGAVEKAERAVAEAIQASLPE